MLKSYSERASDSSFVDHTTKKIATVDGVHPAISQSDYDPLTGVFSRTRASVSATI
jgi:hypothetical protein